MATTLIKGGRIVTAEGEFDGDILIENGKVRMLGTGLPAPPEAEVHDASGLLVMPGAVDVHTHLDWEFGAARSIDTFGTGTVAAAFGGTTSVIDFANQSHGASPLAGLDDWHRRCASRCVDVGAHMIILDPTPQALGDLRTLAHDEGVTRFKMVLTPRPLGGTALGDGQARPKPAQEPNRHAIQTVRPRDAAFRRRPVPRRGRGRGAF